MRIWHITLSSVGRHALFPDEAPRRAAVHILVRVTRDRVLLFCIVDDHVHVVVACDPDELRVIRGALVQGLGRASGQPMVAHATPVESRAHLMRLVAYLLDQTTHHRLPVHPALWSGSCFQDLVGARCVSGIASNLARALPRLKRGSLYQMARLPLSPPRLLDRTELRAAGPRRIALASAAALALDPALRGRTLEVVRARRVAAHLCDAAGIRRADLAEVLSLTPQRIGQLVGTPVEPALVRAAHLQLTLESHVGSVTSDATRNVG